MANQQMTVKFWGVRGSIPAPLSPAAVEHKVNRIMRAAFAAGVTEETIDAWLAAQPRHAVSTFGGNTSCVEVRAGGKLIILDMGSGLRELGNSLMPEIIRDSGLAATILVSHVHWDHIQGFPFFTPIYLPRSKFNINLNLWGGVNWKRPLKSVLAEQMDAPMFPMEFKKVEMEGPHMRFHTVSDRQVISIPTPEGEIRITCRRLNHPQETYGYRIEFCRASLAFATDNEGFTIPDPPLVELVTGVKLWIQDLQFDTDEYEGKHGPAKLNWGHSEPQNVARVAKIAQPEIIVGFHHDPGASDAHITSISREAENLSGIRTIAAYEGLTITL